MTKTEFELYTKVLNEVNKLSFDRLTIQISSSEKYFMVTLILKNNFTVYFSIYFENDEDDKDIVICSVFNEQKELIFNNCFPIEKINIINTLN